MSFDEVYEELSVYTKNYVSTVLSNTLFKLVKDIYDTTLEDNFKNIADKQFPKFAGSYLDMTNPTLEFIKTITYILGLEECVELEVFRLKTNLLKQIQKRESAKECQFIDPCLSLIVPDIICTFCNECQNIDFCRDPSFQFPVLFIILIGE